MDNLDGAWYKMGDVVTGTEGGVMTIDYADIDQPPLHVSCRCQLIPIIKRTRSQPIETKDFFEEIEQELEQLTGGKGGEDGK